VKEDSFTFLCNIFDTLGKSQKYALSLDGRGYTTFSEVVIFDTLTTEYFVKRKSK